MCGGAEFSNFESTKGPKNYWATYFKGGSHLTHLFFADDSLLFCRVSFMEWCNIHTILEVYERVSGHKINRKKTSIFFSLNTKREFQSHILSITSTSSTKFYEKYLGLSMIVGRNKICAFAGISGRVKKKLCSWKENFLSQLGKEILFKAVIQGIPTYSMSVFLLPKSLCKDLNALMNRFFWGHKEKETKMVWMSWERMEFSKNVEGMGFRDLECFNMAILAKQG